MTAKKTDCYSFLVLNSLGVTGEQLRSFSGSFLCCGKIRRLKSAKGLAEHVRKDAQKSNKGSLPENGRIFRETQFLRAMHQAFEESRRWFGRR